MNSPAADLARARLSALNARIRACRRCHLAGFLDERESVPIARDPEPDADMPRILLVGQAPGLRATLHDRPFAGAAGEKLRDWLEQGGSRARTSTAASTSPPSPGATPAACPARRATASLHPGSRQLCRPWLEELVASLRPEVVLLVGLLAIRTFLGPVKSLTAVVGTSAIRDGVLYIPLPHPSGVSRWLNEPPNVAAVGKAMGILRHSVLHDSEVEPGRRGIHKGR